MTPLMGGLYLGKALAEGDYLGAMPFIPDILKAVKSAAPNLLREAASKKLTKIQNKLGYAAPPVETTSVTVASAPEAPRSNLIPMLILGAGAFFVVRKMIKARRR